MCCSSAGACPLPRLPTGPFPPLAPPQAAPWEPGEAVPAPPPPVLCFRTQDVGSLNHAWKGRCLPPTPHSVLLGRNTLHTPAPPQVSGPPSSGPSWPQASRTGQHHCRLRCAAFAAQAGQSLSPHPIETINTQRLPAPALPAPPLQAAGGRRQHPCPSCHSTLSRPGAPSGAWRVAGVAWQLREGLQLVGDPRVDLNGLAREEQADVVVQVNLPRLGAVESGGAGGRRGGWGWGRRQAFQRQDRWGEGGALAQAWGDNPLGQAVSGC